MFGLSAWELVIVFLAILLLFGAKRLPEIGSSLGKGIREFKGSIREIESETRSEIQGSGEADKSAPASQDPATVRKGESTSD